MQDDDPVFEGDEFREKLFFTGEVALRTNVSLPKNALAAIQHLADRSGKSLPQVMHQMLEDRLSWLVQTGKLEDPKTSPKWLSEFVVPKRKQKEPKSGKKT